ncbi:hypothetical protein N7454_010250 [Penicillium verhagenii]|nr:hypothetical protein N7454_010250 [Penicillium verhagenii]
MYCKNVGDYVGSINAYGICREYNACKHQGQQLSEKLGGIFGLAISGGFNEYMKADTRVIPKYVSWDEATLLFCAGAAVSGEILASDVKPRQFNCWL